MTHFLHFRRHQRNMRIYALSFLRTLTLTLNHISLSNACSVLSETKNRKRKVRAARGTRLKNHASNLLSTNRTFYKPSDQALLTVLMVSFYTFESLKSCCVRIKNKMRFQVMAKNLIALQHLLITCPRLIRDGC